MKKEKGFFITLEGGEGTGKSTQVAALAAFLEDKGLDVVVTREPGGTPEGEAIRNLFTQRTDDMEWSPMAECLLMFAARSMHIEKTIKPAMHAGKVVICDRFTDSTRAYQGYGHGLDLSDIEIIRDISIQSFAPDLTFILDMPVEIGLARAKGRLADDGTGEDRFENMALDFHNRMRDGFLDIASKHRERCVVVNAGREIDEISKELRDVTAERLGIA